MIRIRLGEADRERLGCPEWLEYDPDLLMVRESIIIKKVTGLAIEEFGQALSAKDPEALAAVVWVALRRSGIDVELRTLDFDLGKLEIPEPEGKDQTQETTTTS